MGEPRTQRRLAAILAADIAGYSRLMGADEAGTLAAMSTVWSEHFNPAVAIHHGRIVKMMGDGALVEFASAVEAVDCALAVQQAMASFKQSRPGRAPLEFRIGVNLGDIVFEGDDIFGDGVNVAARLEGRAPAGGVLISDSIHAQVKGKVGVSFEDAGAFTLKNIETPVRAWRWTGDGTATEEQAAAGPHTLPSIAVLPFAIMSGDPEQEYFADGLVEDIITTLSKLAGLRVIARNSTFVYKGQAVDIRTVAKQLGVHYVLEGSVRRAGGRIRITAQLIDAEGSHVWAERYDRAIDDIFAVQDEITLVLATEMQVKLTEGEQARLRYTTTGNVEAWSFWVQGLHHYRQSVTKESLGAALSCWTKALALDATSSSLNAMISLVHYADARFGWWEDRETAHEKAMSYAERALDLDPENPDANVTAGLALLQAGRHEEAAAKARRAAQLAPGSADAASFGCFILAFAGFPDEAVTHGERALTLSPNYPASYLGHLGNAYRLAGRTEEAIAAFKAYHARVPGFGLVDLVLVYQQSGRPEEAARKAEQLLTLRKGFTIANWASTQYRADKQGLQADIEALRAAGLPMS
ncbi:adenylate/guanylate cyclase domain-containing protein [Pelagibius sp. CAU 1746]|uniref:adenylate/guanylate cyclase domain-containing protein n=1 Tax=Pelagibius sp. CAU 1746 TaxID=3140370 RepID=UPI00325B770D